MPPLMTIPFVLLLLQYYILFIIYICKYIINPVSQQDVKVYKKTGDRCCGYIVFLSDTIRPAKIYLLPICGTHSLLQRRFAPRKVVRLPSLRSRMTGRYLVPFRMRSFFRAYSRFPLSFTSPITEECSGPCGAIGACLCTPV